MSENAQVETTETTEVAETRKRAPAANFLNIVSGRLPLIFVHAIRFNPTVKAVGSNKAIADMFGTSIGKVFDIVKGRNFSYVDADWKPTAEDVAAAREWIARIGAANKHGLTSQGNAVALTTLLGEYEGSLASPEEAAAFAAARAATRSKPEGGVKRTRKPKAEAITESDTADLLQ